VFSDFDYVHAIIPVLSIRCSCVPVLLIYGAFSQTASVFISLSFETHGRRVCAVLQMECGFHILQSFSYSLSLMAVGDFVNHLKPRFELELS